mmetsp:Transcript_83225/g.236099  ORF Transcript_83225/g.236099 Transcript_83225/m.236099 type:complete len:416 (-) Transcript_83225:425-1672(-)
MAVVRARTGQVWRVRLEDDVLEGALPAEVPGIGVVHRHEPGYADVGVAELRDERLHELEAAAEGVHMHLPITGYPPTHHSQCVAISSTRMDYQGEAALYCELQLPSKHVLLRPAVRRQLAVEGMRVVKPELTPGDGLGTASLYARKHELLEPLVVHIRGLGVAAERGVDLRVREREHLCVYDRLGVAALRDAALETGAEEVSDRRADVGQLLAVPRVLIETYCGRGGLFHHGQTRPTSQIVGVYAGAAAVAGAPTVPRRGRLAQRREALPRFVVERVPGDLAGQDPLVPVPGRPLVAELQSRLLLRWLELHPEAVPRRVARGGGWRLDGRGVVVLNPTEDAPISHFIGRELLQFLVQGRDNGVPPNHLQHFLQVAVSVHKCIRAIEAGPHPAHRRQLRRAGSMMRSVRVPCCCRI